MTIHSPSEQLFFITIRLLASPPGGDVFGTAFFVGVEGLDTIEYFVVTARHIVDGAGSGDLFFIPSEENMPTLGSTRPYRWVSPFWTFHPDSACDVAVARLQTVDFDSLPGDVTMFVVLESQFQARWSRLDPPIFELMRRPQPVSELFIVGYPDNYFDRTNGLPILRRGVTASPLSVDYEGTPTFLIDAALAPGSSGSPVLFLDDRKMPALSVFLGMVTSVLPPKGQEQKSAGWIPNLAVVLKAHAILEAVETCRKEHPLA